VFREVLADRLRGARAWSEDPLHVAVTLTQDDPAAGWGDWYTAHELGDAFARLGWKVTYAERYRDHWYELDPSVDVLVCLLDAYELPRAPAHVVTVAWVRNWTERWLSHDWFDDYDVVIASSRRSQELIEERSSKAAHLLPLATNPERFRPSAPSSDLDADVVFVGNYWGQHRGVVDALPPLEGRVGVRVHGKAWEELPQFSRINGGPLPYERLPEAYSSARIVIDDTAGPTKPYGAVNSRLFDALAAGAFVLTDNEAGVRELFDDEFPVWSDAASLQAQVDRHLDDPKRRRELADRYRQIVVSEHTYERRAEQIRDLLLEWCLADRIGISVGIPERAQAERWGDYHFARALQRQLERRGRPTRVTLLPDWASPSAARSDVVLHLFGLSELEPRPGQVNVLWVISHPELVTPALCERYDLVLVASEPFAAELAGTVSVPVVCLHQATDPGRFNPGAEGPRHELLFVGNSRRVRRRIVDDLTETGLDFALYGADWTPDLVDPARVRGEHVRNDEVAGFYANADIVLNDHWDGMRQHGFFSNRLYDALAAGAFVVSDHVDGIGEHFDGGVVTYATPAELERTIRRYLADPAARRARAERGRAAVLGTHTFEHRAERILELVQPILASRARAVTVAED
jgi:spore maturation protein CgeB